VGAWAVALTSLVCLMRRPPRRRLLPGAKGVLAPCVAVPILAMLAMTAQAQPIDLHDDRGASLHFTTAPRRIVSLLPSLTETVCALGACERLVGTDRYSNWPASVLLLPKLGGLEDAQVERIVALKPDVVLAAKSARVIDRLESLGLRVVVVESQTHADVKRSTQLIARLVGQPQAQQRLWQDIDADIARAAARVPASLRGKRVYFEVSSAPYAAGASSFIGETLARLGLGNIVPPALGPFPKLNPEFVVRAKPDVVMASGTAVASMGGRPGWQTLAALAGRSCGFPTPTYETLVRPGPRMGEAALLMADCLAGLESPR
jgi:iron complex transport system substrate-binding protein